MRSRSIIEDYCSVPDTILFEWVAGPHPRSELAFRELYRRYAPRIHAYCFRILEQRQEAEDIFQETFIRFYQSARQQREMINVPAYLLRIARNLCLNHKRDTVLHESLEGIDLPDYGIEQRYENEELLSLIRYAVGLLEHEYREAFVLREYQNLTYEEIAQIVGTSVSNAKSRVFRARQKIKEILAPNIKEFQ